MTVWCEIPCYPGYEASEHGEIRAVRSRVRAKQGVPIVPWVVERHGREAAYVSLGRGNKQFVSRLVCLAFHGLPPAGMNDCCHRNHNSLDNRASNLKWDTHANNVRECYSEEAIEARARWEDAIGWTPEYRAPVDSDVPF